MPEDNQVSRRKVIAALGGATAGSAVLTESKRPEFSVEVAVTEELADLSEEERGDRKYVPGLVENWIDRAVRPVIPGMDVSVEYVDIEPEIDGKAEEALNEWKEASDTGKQCSLLVTGDSYDNLVGLTEEVKTPMESTAALVGEGYDFLELEKDEWYDSVEVSEYEPFEREPIYTPWKTVVVAVHEIGHTLGLDHSDGEVYEIEDGVCATAMAASYVMEQADPEQIRYSDDIYWTTEFSETSRQKLS